MLLTKADDSEKSIPYIIRGIISQDLTLQTKNYSPGLAERQFIVLVRSESESFPSEEILN